MNKTITIPGSLLNIKSAVEEVIALLKTLKADESDIFDIRLSLEESLINAIKYGNKLNEDLTVLVEVSCNGNKFTLSVEDKGNGFDYKGLPDPTNEENLLKTKGRGVFLMKHLMDKIEFNQKGNRITMTKHLKR
jgi:serine/threonine-protein kinase RsbW